VGFADAPLPFLSFLCARLIVRIVNSEIKLLLLLVLDIILMLSHKNGMFEAFDRQKRIAICRLGGPLEPIGASRSRVGLRASRLRLVSSFWMTDPSLT
jgi:hypothetical protein